MGVGGWGGERACGLLLPRGPLGNSCTSFQGHQPRDLQLHLTSRPADSNASFGAPSHASAVKQRVLLSVTKRGTTEQRANISKNTLASTERQGRRLQGTPQQV